MCLDHPRWATTTKFGMWCGVADVINRDKFHAWVEICRFPILSAMAYTTGLGYRPTRDVLTLCNQQLYLMKLIRNRGMCHKQIYKVFHALIMSRLMMLSMPGEVLCQSNRNRPIVIMLSSNDATDMDTLIRFTVCQTWLTQLTWLFLIKCNLRLTVCIRCSPTVRSQLEHLRSMGHDFILLSCSKDL